MGPPGCGKSHLGRALHAAGVCDYRELEPELMARFGMDAQFQANKAAALAFIENELTAQMDGAATPVAVETTGLSDEPMLRRLAQSRAFL
jgi:shikimate kinase